MEQPANQEHQQAVIFVCLYDEMKICRNVSDILTYYRTDSLHITTDCCAIAFIQVDLKQVLQGEIGSQGANCYYRWNGQSIYRLPNIPLPIVYTVQLKGSKFSISCYKF